MITSCFLRELALERLLRRAARARLLRRVARAWLRLCLEQHPLFGGAVVLLEEAEVRALRRVRKLELYLSDVVLPVESVRFVSLCFLIEPVIQPPSSSRCATLNSDTFMAKYSSSSGTLALSTSTELPSSSNTERSSLWWPGSGSRTRRAVQTCCSSRVLLREEAPRPTARARGTGETGNHPASFAPATHTVKGHAARAVSAGGRLRIGRP
jgi:hypothetical protein